MRDPTSFEPLDTRPDCGGERECEQEEDDDAPHLPDAEGDRGDRDRTRRGGRSGPREAAVRIRRCRLLGDVRRHVRQAVTGRLSWGATRPADMSANATRTPKMNPPTWAKNATP